MPPKPYAAAHRRAGSAPTLPAPALRTRGVVGLVGAGLCVAAAAGSVVAPQATAAGAEPAAATSTSASSRADLAAERAAAAEGTSRSTTREPVDGGPMGEAARVAAEQAAAEAARVAAEQAAAEAARVAADAWVLPTSDYRITATFGSSGSRWASGHTGLDFAAPIGTPVVAVHAGTVASVGWAGPYGRRVVVQHADGTETWYCHLSATSAGVGAAVGTGELLGRVGSTGNSTGPHLHLEVRPSGSPVDPRAFLSERGATP